ncbi:MAG: alpha/beta hydrolase family protein [Candidatus Hodarchaeota archaeon]
MEFKNKQFDGSYEVATIDIYNNNELFKGILYYPPVSFPKPYPVIIYFHGFPQLFTLQELVKRYQYLLDYGYAFITFNFRGYRYSEGKVSIKSQVSDALKITEFIETMASDNVFNPTNINIIAHDFGAYIALILSSKIGIVNKLILISPILDLKKHIYSNDFPKTLSYINRFLPGNINGIQNINDFIEYTKAELDNDEYQIERFIKNLKYKKLKILIGENDKLTPISEVKKMINQIEIGSELFIIENMDHDCVNENKLEILNQEILDFFK